MEYNKEELENDPNYNYEEIEGILEDGSWGVVGLKRVRKRKPAPRRKLNIKVDEPYDNINEYYRLYNKKRQELLHKNSE